jgi:hypothetical protein
MKNSWIIVYSKNDDSQDLTSMTAPHLFYYSLDKNKNNVPSVTKDKDAAKKFKTRKLAIGVAEISLITSLMINKNYVCCIEKFS